MELSLENILDPSEIENIFDDPVDPVDTGDKKDEENPENDSGKKEPITEVIDVNTLFDDSPESVGKGDKDIQGEEGTKVEKDAGTSPLFYSSIAKALKDEGVFPDLDDDTLEKIKDPASFVEMFNNQVKNQLDERQRRIDSALENNADVEEMRKYENTLNQLESITEESIKNESPEGENLRKQLIYLDYINRGYTKERAAREVNKSFNAGTDIEDAQEALESSKDYYNNSYNAFLEKAREGIESHKKNINSQLSELKKSVMEDDKAFGEIELDKTTRQKIIDNISKPIYKDPKTGEYKTAIQKYEAENKTAFLKNIGLLYTLTEGFTNIDKLVQGKVKKEVKKGMRELESTLNNTNRNSEGNLNFVSSVKTDPDSFLSQDWDLGS